MRADYHFQTEEVQHLHAVCFALQSTINHHNLQSLADFPPHHTTGFWFDILFYLVISTQNFHETRKPIDLEMVSYALEA